MEVDGKIYETDTAEDIAHDIALTVLHSPVDVEVETIQDWVEDYLMRSERRDVARAYIRYRYKKEVARSYNDDFIKAIGEKLNATNVQNQNANVDEASFGGRIGEAASVMTKRYALDFLVSDMARKNHDNNEIYIHDLDAYAVGSHNCLSIPFDDLLANGFNTRQGDIRPAGSINTAFQLVAVIFQLQSLQQFGGVSATHIDWTMVPYVRKSFTKHFKDGVKYAQKGQWYGLCGILEDFDNIYAYIDRLLAENTSITDNEYRRQLEAYEYAMEMTEKETMQAVEAMYHNLNTLQSRSGNQLPFTSINYGTCTLPEGRMVTRCLLEGSIHGIGSLHKTSIFPCGIFQCMKGVNRAPGDPNYDLYCLALESTAKRLYPNYANVDWSGNAGYDINDPRTYFSTMGCRTANGWDVNGLGQLKDGRGNICPVTIILPTLAMESIEDAIWTHEDELDHENHAIELFMARLDLKIQEAKDMLIERFEWICSQSPASARFMYENGLMAGYVPEEGIRSALKHGTLAIGQLGLAEALNILIGCDHTQPEGMKLAKRIEQLFKDRCAQFKEEYKLNFGVYFTPAENLCHTALKKFKEKYGVIQNVSDKEFFTNSMHVPVWKEMSPFDKIDIESQLTGYSSAGCITYVELDSGIKNNLSALEMLVNYAMDHDIPYFAVNVPNDTCLKCGYCDEFNDACPECGSTNIQQLRRVTGYLTGNYTTAFNLGKQDEVKHRVKHTG
jgi:ribonucleoside-triphosphate reductase